MKKIFTLISVLFILLSYAQTIPSITENYIYSKTYLSDPTLANPRVSETVQYFDGLGRPKQVVNVKASPLGRDVVTHIEYDQFGRQVRDYLPVPQSGTLNGAIVPNPLANATQPSLYGSEKIYAEKDLENSPLDRIRQQIQVGNAWSSKPVKFTYETNAANEVKKFIATAVWSNSTTASSISSTVGYYPASQLYKNTVTDEDGNKTIEFKNGKGQVILVRKVLNATENADTYYVYNDYDQLAFVIPPKAAAASDISTVLAGLCYWYRYDGKGRPVLKKLPGKSWEYTIYDKADRVIMTQDAVMGASKQWLFTKYDAFGRVAYTGIYTSAQAYGPAGREAEQKLVDNLGINKVTRTSSVGFTDVSGMQVYYDNNAATSYPSTGIKVLSVNYYDSYPAGSPAVTNVFAQPLLTDDPSQNRSTKGLPVASYVKNIEDDNWTKTYTWYDTKGRVIGSRSINHLGGYTIVNHKLDFSGTVLQTNTYHKRLATDTQRNIVEYFTYDSQNRLTMHRHKVDSNPVEILAQNKYNELSQLENKKVGGVVATSPLQQIDYKYNIRGWMTKINDPANLNGKLFGYEMRYQSPVNTLFAIGRYNGNIAEIDWRTSKDDVLKRYSYSYDSLNRLNYGHYSEPNGTVPEEDHFGETTEYDLNGNITRLYRNTKNTTNGLAMQIDNLTYTYSGNQLTKVTDASQNYSGYTGGGNTITYDLNGNMISHLDKGLNEIKYNFLNLPVLVKKNNNSGAFGSLSSYLYRTDGTKLKKIYSYYKSDWQANTSLALTTTDYLDGFQYVLESSGLGCLDCPPVSPTLQFMPTAEGYFDFVKNKYIYNYVDHLGNIRLSYFNDGTATVVLDENNYYPFGLKHEGVNVLEGNPAYQYKYNGKELQETGMYDYGARFYMPDLGRWGVVDPLAEKMTRYSPYNYAFNNPLRFIDPDGRQGSDWIKKDNQWTYDANITTAAQAKAAGADDFAKNGTVISDAKIGSSGEVGYVKLSEGGNASYSDFNGYIGSVMNQIQSYTAGNYVRETPSLNTQEGAFANPGAQLASTMLTAMQEAPLAVAPELIAAKYFRGVTFYRTMSQESADIFMQTGKMPAGSETFLSPTRSFAEGYKGVTFKINVKHSTYADLLNIGVKDASSAHPFSNMPSVGKGWKSTNAFFKVEGNQLNVGLGNGKALDIFNSGIKSVKRLP
ncbi:DUF6443 domain-containing protein [Chryseobacterium flavum]|uniref:DUF6443 domain-containing protein n=2 Tax=Chryseobacterium flavum TaxID=415851 RepID=UPI002FDB933E